MSVFGTFRKWCDWDLESAVEGKTDIAERDYTPRPKGRRCLSKGETLSPSHRSKLDKFKFGAMGGLICTRGPFPSSRRPAAAARDNNGQPFALPPDACEPKSVNAQRGRPAPPSLCNQKIAEAFHPQRPCMSLSTIRLTGSFPGALPGTASVHLCRPDLAAPDNLSRFGAHAGHYSSPCGSGQCH
jgi:hypothetical protein